MNEYLPELEDQEIPEDPVQEMDYRPPQRAASRPRQQPPSRRQASGGRPDLGKLALIVSAAALILAAAALFVALRGDKEPDPEPPQEPEQITFQFGDMTLVPLEGMPLDPYDRSAFTLDGRGRVVYEKDGRRARTGIDVSVHQQEIDWQAVAADGIDFAILRLGRRGGTEGGLFIDDSFERNLQGALDAGLEVGVYFFSQAITPEEAEEEAEYVLATLNGQKLTYPVAFDWENLTLEGGARTDGLDNATLTRCAAAFCARIEQAGLRPAVYFNQTQGYLRYDLRELTEYELWLAEYGTAPDFYYHFDLWQYSDTGQVAGIQGEVDLDLDLRDMR